MPPETYKLSVLKKRAEFLAVAAHGKKWVTPSFIIQLAPVADSTIIRYGLTASTKVGNAVVRNRCRRRLRAMLHKVLPLHAAPTYMYVLIARPATATNDFAAIKKDLLWAFKTNRSASRMTAVLRMLIWLYRHTISALLGRQCRFLPTCSEYADEALRLHGPVKGSALAFRRICRCHPWGGAGFDPVPLPPKR